MLRGLGNNGWERSKIRFRDLDQNIPVFFSPLLTLATAFLWLKFKINKLLKNLYILVIWDNCRVDFKRIALFLLLCD